MRDFSGVWSKMVHFGTFLRYKKKQKQNKEWIKMLSATAPGFQPFFYAVARQAFNPYLNAVPKPIKSRSDLSHVGFIQGAKRDRRPEFLYGKAREILIDLDKIGDKIVKELNKRKIPQLRKEIMDYLNREFLEVQRAHKSFFELKNLFSWINDDYLLSTFMFHLNLSENFVFGYDVSEIKELIQTDKLDAVVEAVSNYQEEKEILKATLILSLDVLLIWAALRAKVTKDYNFILIYEEAVSNAARTLARAHPEIARKVIMSESM
jgi:hypothetical protein